MPFTPSGIEYLVPDGPFDPTGIALADSLEGRVFVPVANVTERDALAAAFAPAPGKPLLVYREDAPVGARFEVSEAGTAFSVANVPVDAGWVTPSMHTSWDARTTLKSRLVGNRVNLRGVVMHDTNNDLGAANAAGVLTLVAGHRPTVEQHLVAVRWVAGGTPLYRGEAAITVYPTGVVDLHTVASTSGVFVDGLSFLTN